MQIGKPGDPVSAICHASADRIEVRGRDLCGDLMGRVGFTEYFHLLLTGREPSEEQRTFLDLLLVSIAEHGLTPTNVAARMTYAAAPDSLQGAQARVAAGAAPADVARETAAAVRASGGKMPGFGHPLHRPVDPRAVRILELADERGVSGAHVLLARELEPAVAEAWGRALPMNVQMPIAAVLLDLDFPPSAAKAIPLLARTAGLLAHLAEEQQNPIGFLMAARAEEAIGYEPDLPLGA